MNRYSSNHHSCGITCYVMFSSLEHVESASFDPCTSGSSGNLRRISDSPLHLQDAAELSDLGNFRSVSDSISETSRSSENFDESLQNHPTHDDEISFLPWENINPEVFRNDQIEISEPDPNNAVYDATNFDNGHCSTQFDTLIRHNSDCYVSTRELSPNNEFNNEVLGCDNDVINDGRFDDWKSGIQVNEWNEPRDDSNIASAPLPLAQDPHPPIIDLTHSPRNHSTDRTEAPQSSIPSSYHLLSLMNGFSCSQPPNYPPIPTNHQPHFLPFNQPINHPGINQNTAPQQDLENFYIHNQPNQHHTSHNNHYIQDNETKWPPNIAHKSDQISIDLVNKELWRKFHEIGTEMIITKAGRRMFPSIKLNFKGLDPTSMYILAIDILPVDNNRYRYVYHSSQWMAAGTTEASTPPRTYVHPDSPASGDVWMKQPITFDKLKLTNNEQNNKGHLILHSMHKYQPRIHLISCGKFPKYDVISYVPAVGRIDDVIRDDVMTFVFPECAFTTVTAYQNQQITQLKIDRNPFAKGFRDSNKSWKPRSSSNNERQTATKRQWRVKTTSQSPVMTSNTTDHIVSPIHPMINTSSHPPIKRNKLHLEQAFNEPDFVFPSISPDYCVTNLDNDVTCSELPYQRNPDDVIKPSDSGYDACLTSQSFLRPFDVNAFNPLQGDLPQTENAASFIDDFELELSTNGTNSDVKHNESEYYVISTSHSENDVTANLTSNNLE
nr:T-box transcription factor Ci-Tbx15/18/22 isoform X1 [Ciona intestinalis]|eukprot:XP_026695868.1 T-box transcription factor Ci-Tbx15/18/22 isoform X1 [Ciona intestinalis]